MKYNHEEILQFHAILSGLIIYFERFSARITGYHQPVSVAATACNDWEFSFGSGDTSAMSTIVWRIYNNLIS